MSKRKSITTIIASLIILVPTTKTTFAVDLGCPNANNSDEIQKWRDSVAKNSELTASQVVQTIEKCFARDKIPLCVQRVHGYNELRANEYDRTRIVTDEEFKIRRPPSIFPRKDKKIEGTNEAETTVQLFVNKNGVYKDAEQIANEKGWPVVRYKSRHSGGFDGGTSNLIMIHVPGAKLNPPVDYDQYINIAVPADPKDLDSSTPTKDVSPLPIAKMPTPEDYKKEANGELTGPNLPRVFTIVSVKKKTRDQPAKVWFDKYNRVGSAGEFERERNPEVLNSCVSCHPNGLRAISPLGYHVNLEGQQGGQVMADEMWRKVRDMDASMNLNVGFKVPDLGSFKDSNGVVRPAVNFAGMGPVYGPIQPLNRKWVGEGSQGHVEYPTRSEKFIKSCAESNPSYYLADIFGRAAGRDNKYTWDRSMGYDWKKVKKAMNCASCHDGVNRGALTSRTGTDTINYKILVDQSMPVGYHKNPLDQGAPDRPVTDMLNPNERIALASCLTAEFELERGKSREWMTEMSCATNKPIPPGPHLNNLPTGGDESQPQSNTPGGSSGHHSPVNSAH